MHEMKGVAKTMMVGQSKSHGQVELARFPDGSWTIRRNGPPVGVWEPHEIIECFRVFGMMTGLDIPRSPGNGPAVVVVVRRGQGQRHPGAPSQWN